MFIRDRKYVANIPTSCAREMEPTETRLTLFPNPVSGVLNIVLPNVEDVRSYELRTTTLIEILDITGKTIHSEEISVDAGQLWTINVNDWPEGVYLLRLTLDNKMWNKKFVVGGH